MYGIKIGMSKIASSAVGLSLPAFHYVCEIQHFLVDCELLPPNGLVSVCERTKCPWIYPTLHCFVYFYRTARYGMYPILFSPRKAAAP